MTLESQEIHTTASNLLVANRTTSVGVKFENVVKDFGSGPVLPDLNLEVLPGEFLSLLGPSGCGKTTALRLLAGLESLTSGVISIGDADVSTVPPNKRDLGMVFQAYSLFPHLSAVENVMFGLQMRSVSRKDAKTRASAALDLVGLSGFGNRYPAELSGGQQQRVALARALVTEPKVLLLDEPLSALDAKVRAQLREEIRRIQLRLGITTIFVTHDQEEALSISDRVAVMSNGGIEQVGTPEELYLQPANAVVAEFVGLSNQVPGEVVSEKAIVWGKSLSLLEPHSDGPVTVYLRPENLKIVADSTKAATSNLIHATVQESIFLGSLRRTRVRTDDGTQLRVQHSAETVWEYGDSVFVGIRHTSVAVSSR